MKENLARKLRVLRAERGISLTEAEELTGVTRETLAALERGERGAYTSTLAKIATAYDVSVSELLEEPVGGLAGKGEAPPEESSRGGREDEEVDRVPLEAAHSERYLRPLRIFADKMRTLWLPKIEHGGFDEEEFRRGVALLLDFEGAFVAGVGTDILAATKRPESTVAAGSPGEMLTESERRAIEDAQSSIDAWHDTMWRAYDVLERRGVDNVARLEEYRTRLAPRARAS